MKNKTNGAGKPAPQQKETTMTTIKYESIRTAVREVEAHIKSTTGDKSEQLAIIGKAQSLTIDNESNLAVLIIVKRRIYKGK